jgi:type IV pilus assembly protein PilM
MALSLSKTSARGSVGLDIDGAFLAAVQVDGTRVQRAASMDLPPGAVSDGVVVDRAALSSALKDFFKRSQLPQSVRLGVSNQQIVVRQIDLPPIEDAAERDMAVRFQAAEAIAMPLDDAVLDHQVVGQTTGADGARMQVVVVAARQEMIDELVEATRGAGLRPEAIDLDAFALVRTLADPGAVNDPARVYCHLGGITNLAIATGASCSFTRTLSTPWSDGNGSTLGEEIRLSIDYYMAQPEARPAAELILSGPGSRQEELTNEVSAVVGLPTTVASPLGRLDASGLEPGEDPHRYTVAAGLALGEGP